MLTSVSGLLIVSNLVVCITVNPFYKPRLIIGEHGRIFRLNGERGGEINRLSGLVQVSL